MTMAEQDAPLLVRRPGRRLSQVLRDLQAREGLRISVGDIGRTGFTATCRAGLPCIQS